VARANRLGSAPSDRRARARRGPRRAELAVARTASGVAWAAWAGGLLAAIIPRTVSLTALRLLVPAVLPVALWAALQGDGGVGATVAVGWAALALLSILWPEVAESFADGSSYGDERRMLLRTPTTLLLGPIPLVWLVGVGGPVAAALLLACEQWVLGGVLVAVSAIGTPAAVRAIHGLARRWVVFVPAGVVLHDLQTLGEAVLFPRSSVAALGVAGGDPPIGVLDLTRGTVGLALQLDLREPLPVSPRRGRRAVDLVDVDGLRFAPARPGAILDEARRRRVGLVTPDR
jgi:hypothetical protein